MSDKVLEPALPLGSCPFIRWLPAGLLCVGGILEEDDAGDPPLRGDVARASDRVPGLALLLP